MKCKYCNEELVDGKPFCPSCGKVQEPETEVSAEAAAEMTEEAVAAEEIAESETAENMLPLETEAFEEPEEEAAQSTKASPRKRATAVVAGIVLLSILIGLLASSFGGSIGGNEPTIAPTSGTVEPTEPVVIPSNGDPSSALCKPSYTVSDEEAVKAADVVVATMGDRVLTNGELQAYYWQEVYMFLQEYGSYASYIGLDMYTPLDQQLTEMGEQPMSWQQFLLDSAIYTWKNYQSMALEAEKANYQLSAERQAELDGMAEELENAAASSGFENADAMVRSNVGGGCDLETYRNYVNVYYTGMSYYYDRVENMALSDEQIDAFFTENEEHYISNNMGRDAKYVDVRHVLLMPEGGETGADGYPVYTDEAWAACQQKAEEIYSQWQQGDLSEDSFAQLAMDYSVDGNASTGGLYENVYKGQMVESFENWCFDPARQVGDHGLVKTPYGYHIMFFSRESKFADLWYVLLQPESNELGEDGNPVYTEEAWAACQQKAEEIYSQWQQGDMSEESFQQMAKEHAAGRDGFYRSVYENTYSGGSPKEIVDWCFDEAHSSGDHGMIKTSDGYYLVFYRSARDLWYLNAESDLRDEKAYDMIPEVMELHPSTVDYSLIELGELNLY